MVLFAQFQNDPKPARPHPAKNNLLRDRLSAGLGWQNQFMARTKKMADPYHINDVLSSINRAFHDAEVSLDSLKSARAETTNVIAQFTLLAKENERLRVQLFRAEDKLKRFYKFKEEAEDAFNALSAIKKLCSDVSEVDIPKMASKRARVDDCGSDSDSDCNKN